MNEADTCRKLVVPKLEVAGWDNEPHSIAEQRSFTDGRIVVDENKGHGPEPAAREIRHRRQTPIDLARRAVLKVLPISQHGNVNEIISIFGGADQLRNALNQVQTLLYAA